MPRPTSRSSWSAAVASWASSSRASREAQRPHPQAASAPCSRCRAPARHCTADGCWGSPHGRRLVGTGPGLLAGRHRGGLPWRPFGCEIVEEVDSITMHTDQPCHDCGVEGPLERYVAYARVELLRMKWGSLAW